MSEKTVYPSVAFDITAAARELSVSIATVRNWLKTGVIHDELSHDNVMELKQQIADGTIQRLTNRANKSRSTKTFVPIEYANDTVIFEQIEEVVHLLHRVFPNDIHRQLAYSVAGFCKAFLAQEAMNAAADSRTNTNVIYALIQAYSHSIMLDIPQYEDLRCQKLFADIATSSVFDPLGLLYQSLRSEGDKSTGGSYYTPLNTIDELLTRIELSPQKTMIDPCCGTGSFLIRAIQTQKASANTVFGVDIDANATFLAKINILLNSPQHNTSPNIFTADALSAFATGDIFCTTNQYISYFDALATNPPWGSMKNTSHNVRYEQQLGSREIFSMFVVKALELLKPQGECSMLLPESILNIQAHEGIRKYLLQNARIAHVKNHGRIFTGVFTPVVSLHLRKGKAGADVPIRLETATSHTTITHQTIADAPHHSIQLNINDTQQNILQKIYSQPHKTLVNNAQWALGIVTGDNAKMLSETPITGYEPIFRGKDLEAYRLLQPSVYIKFDRDALQQVAKDAYYRAPEKLIYKFISNKLVFAYDNLQHLTLNSANILIPRIQNLSIKVVLAYLNSAVFQYIFSTFATHKVLRSDLEKLPFPLIDANIATTIEQLVEAQLAGENNQGEIDLAIFETFQLTIEEIAAIQRKP